jgi:hypothetical protein
VVARNDELREADAVEPGDGLLELPVVAGGRQVARDDDDVGVELVDALDDQVELSRRQRERSADVDVADLRDPERDRRDFRGCLLDRR